MALNSRRTAQNLASILRSRFGIQLEETQLVEAFFDAIFQEIRNNLEAEGVESPSEGYFITTQTEGGQTTRRNVQGISTTGSIPRGKFR